MARQASVDQASVEIQRRGTVSDAEINIATEVISRITARVTRDVPVLHLVAPRRRLSNFLARLFRRDGREGRSITASIGAQKDVRIEVWLAIDFGSDIPKTAAELQQRLETTIKSMTGFQVETIQMNFADVVDPDEDTASAAWEDEPAKVPVKRPEL